MEEEASMNGEETIITLLKEINSSLKALKNQNQSTKNESSHCNCHRPAEVEFDDLDLSSCLGSTSHKQNIAERSAPYGLHSKSSESLLVTTFEGMWDPADPDLISYGEITPLDDSILANFASASDSVLEITEIRDCVRHLPPDDHRHGIAATRGNFLRRSLQDKSPLNLSTERKIPFIQKKLGLFEEFEVKLGTGHFWIRDYDLSGCYVHWDCINDPVIRSTDDSIGKKQCNIPGSRWPGTWSTRHKATPAAPWRRIMYV